ncbi:MAG: YHS domain-containing (seleno)protein [Saprospiraceae bacterium]
MRPIILLLLLGFSFQVFAQASSEKAKKYNLEKGIAIQGYDPVAYFSNKALKGDSKYSVNYLGAVYYFVSESNKNYFLKNPISYVPQYGGWCAYAMGNSGEKVEIDSKTFKIVAGKLYLFYNAYFTNTLKSWNQDETNLKNKADKNWSNLIK